MWHKYCPFCSLCPRQTLLADVSTSWLSYMATSESLSTYIPGSHANRSELQHKMKPLPQACTSSGKLLLSMRSHQAQTKLLGNRSWWKVRSRPANCERPSKRNSGIWVQPITRWLCFSYQFCNQVQRASCDWTPWPPGTHTLTLTLAHSIHAGKEGDNAKQAQ